MYGGVPLEVIYEVINDGKVIDPNAKNWKELVVDRLAKAHFYTDHLRNREGDNKDYRPLNERGISAWSYAKSSLEIKNLKKISAIAMLFFIPGFYKTLSLYLSNKLSSSEKDIFLQTCHFWLQSVPWVKLIPAFAGLFFCYVKFKPTPKKNLSEAYEELMSRCPTNWTHVYMRPNHLSSEDLTINKLSPYEPMFNSKYCLQKHFDYWWDDIAKKIHEEYTADAIPAAYQSDEVLSKIRCMITKTPIRIPFTFFHTYGERKNKHDCYEETFILAWRETQRRNNKIPLLYPIDILVRKRDPNQEYPHWRLLYVDHNVGTPEFNRELSDTIELRLLLLQVLDYKKNLFQRNFQFISNYGT